MSDADDFEKMHTSAEEILNLSTTLSSAFVWAETMEGFHFWSDVSVRLREMQEAYKEWEKTHS